MNTVPETPASEDPILVGLNPIQRQAVLHGEGPLLVLAGAGSGKTRVLTRRAAYLILRRDVPPERVLAVTFTNKAAGEMRERIERLLDRDAAGLWIGTFHSICLRLLRRHGDRLGFRGPITVFDQDDQTVLLREVLKASGGEQEAPRIRELQSVISMAKNRLWDPDDLARKWKRPGKAAFAELYRDYQAKLRAQDGVDFDDLLVLALRLLESFPDLGDAYARKFLHILVDEYQDTNHVQDRLIRRLGEGHGNVTVVGDDDQSIYGWRGADVTNILQFERSFPGACVLRMTQNYRSTRAILDVANAVVKRNRGRLEKSLWTENEGGGAVRLRVSEDEEEEARSIIEEIRIAVRDGRLHPGQITLLYRIHAQSRPFEEACLTLGVPYVIVGGIAFYQRREVKDLLAYLRLAVNPRDLVSFRRVVAAPRRGIGEVSLERIAAAAAARFGGHLIRTCSSLDPRNDLRGKAGKKAVELGHLLEELEAHVAEGPEPLLRRVIEATDYLTWLKVEESANWEERQANVWELLEGAGRFQAARGEGSLEAYLDQVALYTSLDRENLGADHLRMMTVHNAKGLEFVCVYITGLEEGLFPHASALEDDAELEEERRLFYVATTRAMKELTLSASLDRRRLNRSAGGGLSRFLGEVPEELLEIESGAGSTLPELMERSRMWGGSRFPGGRNGGSWRFSPGRSRGSFGPSRRGRSSAPGQGGEGELREGDVIDVPAGAAEPVITREPAAAALDLRGRQVRHAVFGVGRVDDQDGSGPDARLAIYFPGEGRKKILARFVQPIP